MKIASVDIGTNAVKSKIFETTPTSIKYIDGIRSPIRLGTEVFKEGEFSDKKLNELIETLKKYQKKFIKVYLQNIQQLNHLLGPYYLLKAVCLKGLKFK